MNPLEKGGCASAQSISLLSFPDFQKAEGVLSRISGLLTPQMADYYHTYTGKDAAFPTQEERLAVSRIIDLHCRKVSNDPFLATGCELNNFPSYVKDTQRWQTVFAGLGADIVSSDDSVRERLRLLNSLDRVLGTFGTSREEFLKIGKLEETSDARAQRAPRGEEGKAERLEARAELVAWKTRVLRPIYIHLRVCEHFSHETVTGMKTNPGL